MLVQLRRIAIAIFSAVYLVLSFSWMLVGATLTLVLLIIGVPYQRVHVWVTAPIFTRCVQLSLTRLEVHYHPDFEPERRSVFVQNHINLLDGHVASSAIPHAFSGLMNAWQFKLPIYGWLMSMSKGIPVRRGRRSETIKEISEAARNRKQIGMSVLAFPEGHRTVDGSIHPFRQGVFMMARNAEMPIVPIAVRGMYEVNRKGSFAFYPGRSVDVFVGPQFEVAGLSDAQVRELSVKAHDYMEHCVEHGTWPEEVKDATPAGAAAPSQA